MQPKAKAASVEDLLWLKNNIHKTWDNFISFLESNLEYHRLKPGTSRIASQCCVDLPNVKQLKELHGETK